MVIIATMVTMSIIMLILSLILTLTIFTTVTIGATGHQCITIVTMKSPVSPLTPLSPMALLPFNGDPGRDIAIYWHQCRHLNGSNGDLWRSAMAPMTIAIAANGDEVYHWRHWMHFHWRQWIDICRQWCSFFLMAILAVTSPFNGTIVAI